MGNTHLTGLVVGDVAMVQNATFSATAEAVNARTVTIQLVDGAGDNINYKAAVNVFLATSASDLTVAAAPSAGTAIGAKGTIIKEHTAEVFMAVTTDVAGAVELTLTEVTAKNFFVAVVLPGGKIVVSSAIAFA